MITPGIYSPAAGAISSPPGGYSTYAYGHRQSGSGTGAPPLMNDYSIHQQVYRPTEGEAAIKNRPAKEPRGKLEERAGKLEKGVGGFLKKLEKKYG